MITTLGFRRRRALAAAGRRAALRRRRRGRVVRLLATAAGVVLIGLASGPAHATPGHDAVPAAAPMAAPAEPCDPVEDFGCIPEPAPLPEDDGTAGPDQEEPDELEEEGGPGGFSGWVMDGVTSAINGFFADLAAAALDPLLDVLGDTLLVTPTPDELPQVDVLWSRSWQIALACYSLLVMAAGLIVMGHQTVQTQYSAREIAPRIVVGFLASFLSLWAATRMIVLANGLSRALMSNGVQAEGTSNVLKGMINGSLASDGMFTVFIGLVIAAFGLTIIVSYVVRVALTVIMIAGAPLALACHALPQTESIAKWWWRAFAGLLAIQVAQSLTLVTALNVFLGPDGFQVLGGGHRGLVNLSVALALFYILFKIPAWILAATRLPGGGGRSLVGSAARTYLAYKSFGLLRGGAAAKAGTTARAGAGRTWQARRPRATATSQAATAGASPARGVPRRSPGLPVFRPPTPASATPRPRRASGAPGMPVFHPPVPDERPSRPPRRVDVAPGPPLFLAPRPDPANRARPPASGSPPRVPTQPPFRPPQPHTTTPPQRATGPAPAATFRPAQPPASPPPSAAHAAPRRRPPPPATFRPPPPPPRTT